MLSNIIIFFIILLMLTLILHYSNDYKEGFFDFPDVDHNVFVNESAAKFNQLTNTINLTDPALPVTPDSASAFKVALGGLDVEPKSSGYNLKAVSDNVIPQSIPVTFQTAQSCEAAGTSCSAFDDPTFAANCGMSFDKKGVGSNGKPHIGGLFIASSDRQRQTDAAANVLATGGAPYDPYKVYQPTLGKAKPGTFALNKDQCIIVKEKVDCAAKQTFSSPNCTQCYTSQNFARVGPETGRIPSTLYLFGSGNVYVASENNTITLPINKLDPNNPISVEVPANAEGTVFSVVAQQPNNNPMPYIAGYIQGQTPRGTFKLDLFNLVESDQVSKSKPKINGSITVNGFRCLTMIPGTGQTYLNLACIIPFSFLSMYDGDAMTCDNGPIITQAASATFLESDPCFSKANKPGAYKLECLQTRWTEMGGTPQGTGYPKNQATADAIQKDANGNPLDIDTIVNNLAPKMTAALTGQDENGNNLSIPNWNTVSMWATGIPINTPCDSPTAAAGPLSQECLSYLYLNQGINSHIGATYTLASSAMASMKGQNTPNTYCQPGTSLDPATPAGLKFGKSLGGINAVKQTYDQINRLANDNSQTNSARAQAVQQCYGVSIDPMSAPKATGPTQVFAVGPGYNYSKAQAQQVCSQYGAQVATTAQLTEAQTYGADWCFTGWVSDSSNAMYPITTSTQGGCGNGSTGIIQYNTGGNAGVNCYGPKPTIDSYPENTIIPFSQTLWDQPGSKPTATPSATQGVLACLAWPQNGNYQIFYADSNIDNSNTKWTQIPGGLTSLSLAPQGFMFGTNSNQNAYFLQKYNGWSANSSWAVLPNTGLRQIYTDGTIVCGTNSNNNAFAATVSAALAGQWVMLPSVLTKIITYNGQYYCVGLDQNIYYLTAPNSQWVMTMTSGIFKDIAIDENGVILLLGTDNGLYYSDSGQFTPGATYTRVVTEPANFQWQSGSISKGTIYAIDTTGQAWFMANYKSNNWIKINGTGQAFATHRITST